MPGSPRSISLKRWLPAISSRTMSGVHRSARISEARATRRYCLYFCMPHRGTAGSTPPVRKVNRLGRIIRTAGSPRAKIRPPASRVTCRPAADLLDSFEGRITPAARSWRYRTTLVVVSLVMVMLPVIYVSIIGVVACGVVWYALHADAGWLPSLGLVAAAVYFCPLVAGATLVFFMVKPLFKRRARPVAPLRLERADEPLLFAFIDRICGLIRAPAPAAVAVDSGVNASAGLTSRLLDPRRLDLSLTLGLPVVGSLTAQELAGVVAH